MFLPRLILAALCSFLVTAASAHEFWIEPLRYQVAAGERIEGNFKNGEAFKGGNLSFFSRSSERFEMWAGGAVVPIKPRDGDRPALSVDAPVADGLVVVAHETGVSRLTYREWEKFLKFARHKDFPDAAADHAAAGWPKEGFREAYSRHVKALIAVGSGAGADQAFGLKTEIVALTNPYAEGFGGQMRVQVLLDGAPRPDAQVEVFDRAADDSVTVTLHRTDGEGIAVVPVISGHDYLFDAVVLEKHPNAGTDDDAPVWQTFWAALTFMVP